MLNEYTINIIKRIRESIRKYNLIQLTSIILQLGNIEHSNAKNIAFICLKYSIALDLANRVIAFNNINLKKHSKFLIKKSGLIGLVDDLAIISLAQRFIGVLNYIDQKLPAAAELDEKIFLDQIKSKIHFFDEVDAVIILALHERDMVRKRNKKILAFPKIFNNT